MTRFKLSACIEWLFAEAGPELPERIRAAGAAGIDAVEFWMWRDRDLDAIAAAAQDAGVAIAGMCVDPWGQLTQPSTHDEFLQGVRDTCEAARRIGCTALVSQVGAARPDAPRAEQHDAIVSALTKAAPIVADAGIVLNIEPLNTKVDHVGYFLPDTAEGVQIVREVNEPSIGLLYDRYHSATMGEAIGYGVDGNFDIVNHVHIADTKGRQEPGTGDLDWPAEIAYLRSQGYDKYLGLEYQPSSTDTAASLSWFRSLID